MKYFLSLLMLFFWGCENQQQPVPRSEIESDSTLVLREPPGLRGIDSTNADTLINNARSGKIKEVRGGYTKFDSAALAYFRSRTDLQNMTLVLGAKEFTDSVTNKKTYYPTMMLRFEVRPSVQEAKPQYRYFTSDKLCPPPPGSSCDD